MHYTSRVPRGSAAPFLCGIYIYIYMYVFPCSPHKNPAMEVQEEEMQRRKGEGGEEYHGGREASEKLTASRFLLRLETGSGDPEGRRRRRRSRISSITTTHVTSFNNEQTR